jgi:pimeloyl-ACP methyl ester carboxylesterase/DNA-binding CsgD family transcriptional regulator
MPGSNRTPQTRDQVRFCRSIDGARIAYATHGEGPPLLVNTCWLSHLQHDWESPVWRHFLHGLGGIATVTRYDERGFGLSDRDVPDFTFESRVADLEAVVDAAGLDRFALLGMAQGGPVAIAYAHRHPVRVTRLILSGTHAGGLHNAEDEALEDTFSQMIRVGWARPDALFRRVFTNLLIPDATEEQMRWIDELQRTSTSAEVNIAARSARRKVDVRDLLSELRLPTLVLHAVRERMTDFAEARMLASSIPEARLVTLDSANHILLADEPAWPVYLSELTAFLAPERRPAEAPTGAPAKADLTDREQEILRLAARGLDNVAIAGRLTLSVRTVERHLSNAYTKLGVSGKVARTAAVAHLLSEES